MNNRLTEKIRQYPDEIAKIQNVVGKKVDGKWNLKITFYDRYDFETQAWEDSITIGSIVKILNNYAAYAQEVGAIVPYDIKVTVEKSF